MNARALAFLVMLLPSLLLGGQSRTIFERTSPYHHIRVIEQDRIRTLCFDDALETSMSLDDPLQGHFEYIDYFHMPWLWNTGITSVVMIGLGGGSAQRSFVHYYPNVRVETVEIDPVVHEVAKAFFAFKESERQKVNIEDGRVFLRRSQAKFDLLIVDAYVQNRYGSSIPQHLATKEFFQIANERLNTNGIVAYNVIGTTGGWRSGIIGAIYKTLKAVYPQVYVFPCRTTQNVVLLATKATGRVELAALNARADQMIKSERIRLPYFRERLAQFRNTAPLSAAGGMVLTDDYAPVEGLAK